MVNILLFYTGIESFNYYADCLYEELTKRGHNVFIVDLDVNRALPGHTYADFWKFKNNGIDLAIAYDDLGFMMKYIEDGSFGYNGAIDLKGRTDTCLINIMVDPPFRFHGYFLATPPQCMNYVCDRNHLLYMRDMFPKIKSDFLPHGASPAKGELIPYEDRKYDLLFTGTFYDPEGYFASLKESYPEATPLYTAYRESFDLMKEKTGLNAVKALDEVLTSYDIKLEWNEKFMLYQSCEQTDWAIRMYMRGKIIKTIADSGLDIYLIGRGWDKHPSFGKPNVHWLSERVTMADTLKYMENAKISLNVMPWFKDGSHERPLNALLHGSLTVTDPSGWLLENFKPDKEMVYFNLNKLDRLPDIIRYYLTHTDEAKAIISAGKKKIEENWTWKQLVDRIL